MASLWASARERRKISLRTVDVSDVDPGAVGLQLCNTPSSARPLPDSPGGDTIRADGWACVLWTRTISSLFLSYIQAIQTIL